MSYASFWTPLNLSPILKVFDFDEPLSLNTAIQLLKTLKGFNAILS